MSFFQTPPSIVESVEIAYGVTPQGDEFSVYMVRYDRKMRGAYDESCVVQFGDKETHGFRDWNDAKRWLTGNGDVDVTVYDDNGEQGTETRKGRRVPPGLIVETALPKNESREPVTNSEVTERGRTDPFDADDHVDRDDNSGTNSSVQRDASGATNRGRGGRFTARNATGPSGPTGNTGATGGPTENH